MGLSLPSGSRRMQGVVGSLVRLEDVADVRLGRVPGADVLDGADRQGRGRGAGG